MSGEPRLLIPAFGRLYEIPAPATEPLIRLCAGLSMAAHGYLILFSAREINIAFFAQAGFHPAAFWAIAAGITQFCGGLCLAAGLITRVAAAPVLVFLLVAIKFHAPNGFYWNKLGFEYPLFWAIVVFHFLVRGGGRWSLDRAIGREI